MTKGSVEDGITRISIPELIALRLKASALPMDDLYIRARQGGAFLSPFKGRGMEFEESRRYQPGDDLRSLDWRVTARTGKPFTKIYREERERPVLLAVDFRSSMFFATRGSFKSVVAARAAALLGWRATLHRDRLGAILFSDTEHDLLRPRRGSRGTLSLIRRLSEMSARDFEREPDPAQLEASLANAAGRIRRVARPGSLVFVLSDFRYSSSAFETALSKLAQHCSIVLALIQDPIERELPPPGRYRVASGKRVVDFVSTSKSAEQFRAAAASRVDHWRQFSRRHRMFLLELETSQDVHEQMMLGFGGVGNTMHAARRGAAQAG